MNIFIFSTDHEKITHFILLNWPIFVFYEEINPMKIFDL